MEKIGFFGGSFNPPTIAHLKIVEFSLKEFGLDNYNNISNWKDAEKLLENYKYIVFKRGNNKVQKNNQNTYFVNSFYNISSSDVRKKIKNNRNLEQFITKDVIKFINENNLYK